MNTFFEYETREPCPWSRDEAAACISAARSRASASASASSAERPAPVMAWSRISVTLVTQPSGPQQQPRYSHGWNPARGGIASHRKFLLRKGGLVVREPQARSRARSEAGKMREIGWIVDIQGDAGQVQYRGRNAAGAGGGEVREEAVVAKAERHRVGRRQQDRIRT